MNVATIEARIKEYEAAIANSLANHNGLLGALYELKNLLAMGGAVAEAIAPKSGVSEMLETVENVVDAIVPDEAQAAIEHE